MSKKSNGPGTGPMLAPQWLRGNGCHADRLTVEQVDPLKHQEPLLIPLHGTREQNGSLPGEPSNMSLKKKKKLLLYRTIPPNFGAHLAASRLSRCLLLLCGQVDHCLSSQPGIAHEIHNVGEQGDPIFLPVHGLKLEHVLHQ